MYNIWVPVVTLVLIGILSLGWKLYFSAYIKRNTERKAVKRQKNSGAMAKAYPVRAVSQICIMCSILLANSDEKVADTLKYVKPTAYLDHILEKQNG